MFNINGILSWAGENPLAFPSEFYVPTKSLEDGKPVMETESLDFMLSMKTKT